ncbi:DUF302 domain-containing protein [Nocardia tengchongensis]|uniref:DUF302 domain-containing protein n=1 Tax=Nocardia tengchongensis TaxID=2055889 RepID=A0ABX8CIK5_9NOCA|nr:DUF302 domain-containing protein [Nocardia tengchongensis]QVI19242.1 DUF302 domain-containing protein [Nocardia tengchongensis]
MEYRVNVCETPPQTVLRIPLEIRPDLLSEGIVGGMGRLTEVAEKAGLTASGAPTITFHRELPAEDAIVVDFGLPIEPAPALGPSSGAEMVIQSPTLVARTSHRGSYRDIDAAYRALREWLRQAGYRPVGPPTEAYLIGPDEVSDPRMLITEIRIPVAPAPAIAVHLATSFPEAVERTRTVMRERGFGVVTEFDVQAALRERTGEHIEEYLILGVCNPQLAGLALATDREAGLLMPCTVVVRADETGVLVEAVDPTLLVQVLARPELAASAEEMRRMLAGALSGLTHPAAAAG